jgi:alpha-mannosidase
VALIGPNGKAAPFQVIRTEHWSMPDLPWRMRVVFRAKLPPLGWSVYRLGLGVRPSRPWKLALPAKTRGKGIIDNGLYKIIARKGRRSFQVESRGKPIFPGEGISVINVEDPWGSWGGMAEEPESLALGQIQERWTIADITILERGPERASLWVRFAGARSRIDFTISLGRRRDLVDVHARVFWNERSSRLKLVFPSAGKAIFEVPGGIAERAIAGEVPGGRWVRCRGRERDFGFASDALYGFDQAPGAFRATVVRASRYATDVKSGAGEEPWRPAVDAGELCFRFLITTNVRDLPRLAAELEQPPLTQCVISSKGALPRTGSLFSLGADSIQLIALKPADDGGGWVVRLQETAGRSVPVQGEWLGRPVDFGSVKPWSVNSYRLKSQRGRWKVSRAEVG